MSDLENRPLRPLETYQKRTVRGATKAALQEGRDVLVQAPTGAGKTAMLARTARNAARNGKKALVLTHRKTLFKQLAGNPAGETEKEREGEIRWWANQEPGSIAEDALGGIDQEPGIVIGMVETVGNRLEDLAGYDMILIDETHHASAESDKRDEKGSYARIIDACPDAQLVGFTATIFRGDGDALHPRLENAHQEVVAIEEARASGRIVPARTVIGKARLENGLTPAQLARDELAGTLDTKLGGKNAASIIEKSRGDAYYDRGVDDWDRIAKRSQTIIFMDSVDEVQDMQERFDRVYGPGTAVAIHGRNKGDVNDDAIAAYRKGQSKVLISCQMIGEGFDVPATDTVMSFNKSLSRAQMNQYAGRGIRADDDKTEGLFIDYGTASVLHGPIEHQHEIQNVDALSAAGNRLSAARAIGRMSPVSSDAWAVMPGEKQTLAFKKSEAGYMLYRIDHRAEKELGKRPKAHVSGLQRVLDEDGKHRPLSAQALARVMADQARGEAEFYARRGGFGSEEYVAACRSTTSHWKSSFDLYDAHEAHDAAAERRRELVREDLRGAATGGKDSRLVRKAVEAAKSPVHMIREGLSLTGAALEVCAENDTLPLGLRAEARTVGAEFTPARIKEMKAKELHREGKAARDMLGRVSADCGDKGIARVLGNIDAPLEKGIKGLEDRAREARAART